ncbi:MAG: sulfotransferase [Planctomycetota bacterium]|jgi:hypothetical protein
MKAEVTSGQPLATETAGGDGHVGPVFVSGRQHSGNTVMTAVLGSLPECFAGRREGWFFEQRVMAEKLSDPDRRAAEVVRLLRIDDDADLVEQTRRNLTHWHHAHPQASTIELYLAAMQFVMEATGTRFWVRHATSYIFYAEEILTLIPDARVLYLLRNPYDVCASKKRRDPWRDRFWAWVVSWNRGLRIALQLKREYPDRFLIPFDEAYLNVPHVNRSEAPGAETSESRGLNPSRVYYYPGILTPAEVAAVDMLVWREKLLEYYPDLPHREARQGLWTRAKACGHVALEPFKFAASQARLLRRHDPKWRLMRLMRRLRIAVR